MLQYKLASPIGSLYIVINDNALTGIYFDKQNIPLLKKLNDSKLMLKVATELGQYFAGSRKKFTIKLAPKGTPFQEQVWKELLNIPFGKTISYKELAQRINNPNAMRAVGSANGKNPICLIIPCHRVIAADGGIGGYSGGLHIKEKLLKIEAPQAFSRRNNQ